jgi:LacI family sucrose operon transcriptional repressor
MGHRKIVFLGVTEQDIAVGVKRKAGFQQAVQEAGNCEVKYYETGFAINAALETACRIMDEYRPSIFVCATDNIALGVLKAVYMKGLHVPTDLSITGFGGYEVTEIMHPSLTTAKFYYKEAGQLAAQSMMKLVNGESIGKIMVSQYKIIERESVDKL